MTKGYNHVARVQRSQIYALKAIATPQNKIAILLFRHVVVISVIPVRHESAPPLAAESAAGKALPSAFRT